MTEKVFRESKPINEARNALWHFGELRQTVMYRSGDELRDAKLCKLCRRLTQEEKLKWVCLPSDASNVRFESSTTKNLYNSLASWTVGFEAAIS
jgi:hypothetical protein